MALTKAPEELLDKSLTSALTITTADNTTQLTLTSTDADASVGPRLDLNRDSSSPAADDYLGVIRWLGDDDAGNSLSYAHMSTYIEDPADGGEDGKFEIDTRVAGTMRSRLLIHSTQTVFNQEGQDVDFRVESNDRNHMLFVDAGNNRIGINDSAPQQLVDIYDSTLPVVRLTNGRNESSGSDYDLGKIEFFSDDSSGTGARVLTEINAIADAASAAPGGIFVIKTAPTNSATAERLRIDSAGHITMPSQSSVGVSLTDQNNFAANTITTLDFDTERFDQNSDFNTSTNTFSAPVTGKYLVCINLYMKNTDNAAAYYQLYIVSSNKTYYSIYDPDVSTDSAYWDMSWSAVIDMDASDTVYFRIFQSDGAAQMDLDGQSYASITLLN